MARIGKTGNAKIAKRALDRIRKMKRASSLKAGRPKCRAAVKAFAEAAAHTGAALHGGEKAKGLHKQLHGAEKKVILLCDLTRPQTKAKPKKRSSRRRSAADDFDPSGYFGGGRSGGSSGGSSSSSRSTVAARPTFYAPASGSSGGAFTREQFNRATGFSGLRRRKRK